MTKYSQVGHNCWGSELVTRWGAKFTRTFGKYWWQADGQHSCWKGWGFVQLQWAVCPGSPLRNEGLGKFWDVWHIDFVFCPAVRDTPPIGCDWHYKTLGGCSFKRGFKSVCLWFELSSIVTYSQATSFMDENPVPSIDHYRDLNNGHLGLPSPRVRRSFGSTNPIILKLSSLAGPYAPLVLKAAKIFCKITGPGIFCWKYSKSTNGKILFIEF